MPALLPLLPLLGLLACGEADLEDSTPLDSGAPYEHVFTFAVLADPHLYGNAEYLERAVKAIDWLNENAADRSIELVITVGDITWSEGAADAIDLYSTLELPHVPIIGDNVNLAARLQDLSKVYGWSMIISENTQEQIKDELETEFIEAGQVKGKSEKVKIYKLIGEKKAVVDG